MRRDRDAERALGSTVTYEGLPATSNGQVEGEQETSVSVSVAESFGQVASRRAPQPSR